MQTTITLPALFDVENAIARADAMHGIYSCEPVSSKTKNAYFVQHNIQTKRCYLVETGTVQTCDCKQFAKAKTCKHLRFALDCEEIALGEEQAEEKEFARYEL